MGYRSLSFPASSPKIHSPFLLCYPDSWVQYSLPLTPLAFPVHGSDPLLSHIRTTLHPPPWANRARAVTPQGPTASAKECCPGQAYLPSQDSRWGLLATHPHLHLGQNQWISFSSFPPSRGGQIDTWLRFLLSNGAPKAL